MCQNEALYLAWCFRDISSHVFRLLNKGLKSFTPSWLFLFLILFATNGLNLFISSFLEDTKYEYRLWKTLLLKIVLWQYIFVGILVMLFNYSWKTRIGYLVLIHGYYDCLWYIEAFFFFFPLEYWNISWNYNCNSYNIRNFALKWFFFLIYSEWHPKHLII